MSDCIWIIIGSVAVCWQMSPPSADSPWICLITNWESVVTLPGKIPQKTRFRNLRSENQKPTFIDCHTGVATWNRMGALGDCTFETQAKHKGWDCVKMRPLTLGKMCHSSGVLTKETQGWFIPNIFTLFSI